MSKLLLVLSSVVFMAIGSSAYAQSVEGVGDRGIGPDEITLLLIGVIVVSIAYKKYKGNIGFLNRNKVRKAGAILFFLIILYGAVEQFIFAPSGYSIEFLFLHLPVAFILFAATFVLSFIFPEDTKAKE